ncbi:MAG: SDR family NAD(P)-dependent oxidoreductase, partial [Lachnospiraceae bacterium]
MELGLKKRVVVITGGAAGIGRAAAMEFLQEGAAVAVFGRSEKKIEAFISEMKEAGYEKAVYAESLSRISKDS